MAPPPISQCDRPLGSYPSSFASKFTNILGLIASDCYYIKNAVLFEENSILQLPERFEASGVKFSWGEVSQESPKNRQKSAY